MKKRMFEIYQYLAPAILAPLSFWLWWTVYNGNLPLTLIAWLLPILYAYIVPAVGTNILKVWEFDTRFRLGRFRPQHGFVFGSATAMLAWLCHFQLAQTGIDVIKYAIIIASVLGFWNIVYDIKAIRSGILKVYNQPWADKKDAESIVMDYAPWFFAGFGLVYGVSIAGAEILVTRANYGSGFFILYFVISLALSMLVPVIGYRWHSFRAHGHSGCQPIREGK
jgi:hypothetical protein